MIVRLWDGEIELPNSLTLDERIEYVNDILKRYPNNFEYGNNEDTNHVIEIRLDILGSYIIKASATKKKIVMSGYKVKNRTYQDNKVVKVQKLKDMVIGL